MNKDLYTEKLARFKQNEKPEVVLFVGDDPDLTRIVIAWTNTRVKRQETLLPLPDDSECLVWDWLWQNTRFSRDEIFANSNQSKFNFDERLKALIGNRVLYPDGTINSFVQRYLREKVLNLFEKKAKRQAKTKRTA